jgi:repressor LexA
VIDYAQRRLTRTQERVLLFIANYMSERGYAPTTRDICAHLGAVSPHTALGHRKALERRGLLEMIRYRGRTLRLTAKGKEHAATLREEERVRRAVG